MIEQAKAYAIRTGKPMQVVWSEHGGYQVFPENVGCSIGYRQVFSTEERIDRAADGLVNKKGKGVI